MYNIQNVYSSSDWSYSLNLLVFPAVERFGRLEMEVVVVEVVVVLSFLTPRFSLFFVLSLIIEFAIIPISLLPALLPPR